MHLPLVLACYKKDSLPSEPPGKPLQTGKEAYYGLWRLHKSSWTQRMYCMVTLLWMKSVYKIKSMWRHVSGRRVLPHMPEKGSRQPAKLCSLSWLPSTLALAQRTDSTLALPACDSGVLSVPAGLAPATPGARPSRRWQTAVKREEKEQKGPSSLPLTSCTILGPRCCVSSKAFIFYLKKGE